MAHVRDEHKQWFLCSDILGSGKIILGDSKDPLGPVLVYTPTEFHAFLDGAKKGEFDDIQGH